MKYDLAIVGLGGMGSAILAQTAARGAAVIGLDQYQPAHALGSSHGRSRMIRKAYFEDPAYVPLLQRAYVLWRELESATGEKIFDPTGVLAIGREESTIIAGTKRAAAEHGLPLEMWSRQAAQTRYPGVRILADEVALLEQDAGVLDPEVAIHAHLEVARRHGAELAFATTMQRWEATDHGFDLLLADGRRISARSLVLSLGPWFKATLETLGVPIRIQRNVQVWFGSESKEFAAPGFPAFLVDRAGLPAPLYGFPDSGHGVKAAFHGLGPDTNVEEIDRTIEAGRDLVPLARALEEWMPGAARDVREANVCMYTLTPDEHFVVDRSPAHPNLIVCGGFSGHGFKFAPVIGEIVAEMALNGGTRHAVEFLALDRFRKVRI